MSVTIPCPGAGSRSACAGGFRDYLGVTTITIDPVRGNARMIARLPASWYFLPIPASVVSLSWQFDLMAW